MDGGSVGGKYGVFAWDGTCKSKTKAGKTCNSEGLFSVTGAAYSCLQKDCEGEKISDSD